MVEPSNKTVRAPLFSEQVALTAQLDEASAGQLRIALDLAQQGGNAAKNTAPALRFAGASLGFSGLGLVGVVTLLAPAQATLLVLGGVAIAAIGLVVTMMAAQAEALHGAALVKALAQSIAKRKKEQPPK